MTLQKLCGLRVSASTTATTASAQEKTLEILFLGNSYTGRNHLTDLVAELLEEGETLGETTTLGWQRDAQGRTCAYVSLDATGVRHMARKPRAGWPTLE